MTVTKVSQGLLGLCISEPGRRCHHPWDRECCRKSRMKEDTCDVPGWWCPIHTLVVYSVWNSKDSHKVSLLCLRWTYNLSFNLLFWAWRLNNYTGTTDAHSEAPISPCCADLQILWFIHAVLYKAPRIPPNEYHPTWHNSCVSSHAPFRKLWLAAKP